MLTWGIFGARPIKRAWYLVLIALLINYFGQVAFLLLNPSAKNVILEMSLSTLPIAYVPFLVLALLATIIAS